MKTIGKKIRKQAENLGLTKLRTTRLYARPKDLRMMFSKPATDVSDTIRDYLKAHDPSFIQDSSGGSRNNTFYFLAPQLELYVEITNKVAGVIAVNTANHAIEIIIFSEKDEHIRAIANAINNIWEDGILPHMNWEKIKKKYKVSEDECIAAWNNIL